MLISPVTVTLISKPKPDDIVFRQHKPPKRDRLKEELTKCQIAKQKVV